MAQTLSVDCMGGDHGVSVTIPAVLSFIRQEPEARLLLVGLEPDILGAFKRCHTELAAYPQLSMVSASEVVTMDDPIEVALRRKKDSSMRVALTLVKEGKADACVSAGNTGALMALSRYLLGMMPGIDRPAICASLPNQKDRPTYMLDLGANVDCEPHHLHQFAAMASALVSVIEGVFDPTVGLLNVGSEEIKGHDLVKQTAVLLRQASDQGHLHFYGNVEGHDIFEGTTNIVVCDGFVGNVTLKAAEGLGRFVKTTLTTELRRGFFNQIGAVFARGALKAVSRRLNPSRYNGASLLGLQGLVFKSHGSADAYAYEWVLRRAFDAARHGLLTRIHDQMNLR